MVIGIAKATLIKMFWELRFKIEIVNVQSSLRAGREGERGILQYLRPNTAARRVDPRILNPFYNCGTFSRYFKIKTSLSMFVSF